MDQTVDPGPTPIDYLNSISGDAATWVSLFRGPSVVPTAVPSPQLSVGVTGQSGLLIVVAAIVVAAVYFASKK